MESYILINGTWPHVLQVCRFAYFPIGSSSSPTLFWSCLYIYRVISKKKNSPIFFLILDLHPTDYKRK